MTINYPTGESCTNVHEFWLMRTGLQGGQDSEKYGSTWTGVEWTIYSLFVHEDR